MWNERLFWLKSKPIKKLPLHFTIPKQWVRKVGLKKGDVLSFYIADSGELIIKKEEL